MSMLIENRVSGLYGTDQKNFRSIAYGNDVMRKCCKFDGVGDYGKKTVANFRSSDSLGAVYIKFQATGSGTLLSSADEVGSTKYITIRITGGKIGVLQRNNDTADTVFTQLNTFSDGTIKNIIVCSNNADWFVYYGGNSLTLDVTGGANTGDWFADTADRDNLTIGAFNTRTISTYFGGTIISLIVTNTFPSAGEIASGEPTGNIVGQWIFNEATGNTLNDSSGGGNNLTLTLNSAATSFYTMKKEYS